MVKVKKVRRLEKKILLRKLDKGTKMSVKIQEFKEPSILGNPNRFFKDELEETKRSMFL